MRAFPLAKFKPVDDEGGGETANMHSNEAPQNAASLTAATTTGKNALLNKNEPPRPCEQQRPKCNLSKLYLGHLKTFRKDVASQLEVPWPRILTL